MRNRFLSSIALSLAVALAAPAALAQQPVAAPPGDQPLPRDSAVRVGELANGVRFYIRENREPQKRAELRLVVNAGSVLEDADQRGLAHWVEHMAFNGTRNFEKQALVDYLERIGMRFGPDINAYTSFDETVYMLTLPTDSAGVVETGMQILEDWAHGVQFDSLEVEKERGVVIEEWRLGRGASERLRAQQFPVLFRGSRYAERLPIGTRESLERASVGALRRFYRDWYRPELMAVVAVGDFDAGRMEALIRQHFGRIPRSAQPRERVTHDVPDHAETLFAIGTDPEAPSTLVGVMYKQPLQPERTVADYRRELVEQLYNGMLNERLGELAQQPDPPFAGAFSGQGRLVRPKEVYQLLAQVPSTGVERGLEALLTEAKRVAEHGFTTTELERLKSDMLRGMEQAYAERNKTPSGRYASEYVTHFLSDVPFPGIEAEYALYQQLIPGIGLEEVNRLAREWLTDRNRVIMVTAPQKEGVRVPDRAALLAVFDAVRGKPVTAYQDEVSDEPLLEAPPPGRIVSERRVPGVEVIEWRLSNGARVLIKPTDFRADQILFSAYSPGGASLVPDEDHGAAVNAPAVLGVGGLGRLNDVELRKRLAGKAVSVGPSIGLLEEGMGGSASPKDLETFFQLIHLNFTAPRADSAAFQAMRDRFRAVLEQRAADPEQAFSDTVQVTLSQHHPRARPVTLRTVEELDLERSLRIYRERFADAGDFTFVFVGSVDTTQLRPLVETYLASLPASGRRESWKDVGIRPPRGVVRREVRRGTEPKSQTQLVLTGPFQYTPEQVHALRSMGELLNIRLRDDLREEQSGTYGASVRATATLHPTPRYQVSVSFGSAPERREELLARVFAQLDSLKRVAPSAEEVAKLKELQRRTRETSLRQNGYWLGMIGAYDRQGWDLAAIPSEGERIERLDARAIQEVARAVLDTQNYVLVTLLPEDGAAGSQ